MLAVKGKGVHGFTLDSHVGEFILTKPYMRIPEVCMHACIGREAIVVMNTLCRNAWGAGRVPVFGSGFVEPEERRCRAPFSPADHGCGGGGLMGKD